LFQRALVEDFAREDIHRQLMKLYAQLGRRSEVAAHYQRLIEDFKKAGKSPSPETQAVYAEIMG
jgi:DNA-binding SARP family transcriptional activator